MHSTEATAQGKDGIGTRAAGNRTVSPAKAAGMNTRKPAALLRAIRQVESAGDDHAIGDGGLARGPFQIHLVWWLDSGGTRATYYRDVENPAACRVRIMILWQKRCPAALASDDLETLARTFRRPTNPRHIDNAAYWAKVQKAKGD